MLRQTGITSDLPILFWDNIVTATLVEAESETDFPASNVANPATALKWKHESSDSPESAVEYFRVDISQANPINYVAIAGHNFSTAGIAVGLELAEFGSPLGGAESVFEPQIPDDDGPIIFAFPLQEIEEIRIILVTGTSPAEIAVLYAGQYTQLSEGIQASHTPLPLANVSDVLTGRSENGEYLGRIITGGQLISTATIANMETDFVRDTLMPFLLAADEFPFFWAWQPVSYPEDVAFAWLDNDAQPVLDIDGYWAVDLAMKGTVA
jgi:hypothetical protein